MLLLLTATFVTVMRYTITAYGKVLFVSKTKL